MADEQLDLEKLRWSLSQLELAQNRERAIRYVHDAGAYVMSVVQNIKELERARGKLTTEAAAATKAADDAVAREESRISAAKAEADKSVAAAKAKKDEAIERILQEITDAQARVDQEKANAETHIKGMREARELAAKSLGLAEKAWAEGKARMADEREQLVAAILALKAQMRELAESAQRASAG